MSQLYMQKFENLSAASKSEFDQTWGVALATFAKSGTWGGVEKGVKHLGTYGTSWGGYVLIDVEDPAAFTRYQMHHYQNYGHIARVTFEPVFDMDAAFADTVRQMKAK